MFLLHLLIVLQYVLVYLVNSSLLSKVKQNYKGQEKIIKI